MTQTPLALITGGAQGIGYACAEALKEDGFDVINALDAEWDEVVPAVLMTADRRGEIRERALEQGLAFLQKPITDTELRDMLERL